MDLHFIDELLKHIQSNQLVPTSAQAPAAPADDTITVTGEVPQGVQPSRPVSYPDAPPAPKVTNGPTPPDLGNRSYIEAAQAAANNVPGHKGMFGLHGTLRDILGMVGDAMLVQSGRSPIYSPARQEEKTQDALSGFTVDPVAAQERLAQTDTKTALQLHQDSALDDYRKDNLASLERNRSSEATRRAQLGLQYAQRTAANLAAAAGNDPARQGAAADRIIKLAEAFQVDPGDLGYHIGMTSNDWAELGRSATNAYQGAQIDALPERLGIAHQNADANTTRAGAAVTAANRPRGGSQRAETELEAATAAANTPPEKRTPAQKLILSHYQYGTKGPSIAERLGIGAPPAAGAAPNASAAPSRFKIVHVRSK
jgi:hypothetical protein